MFKKSQAQLAQAHLELSDAIAKAQAIFHFIFKIWFVRKDMDPWIHGSAAGPAARAAAGAAAGAAASASAVCVNYVIIGGALRAPLHVHDKIHTAAAEAEAPAAALALSLIHISEPTRH